MPKIQLTDTAVKALAPPQRGQVTYWDQNIAGFGVRVSQGGRKSFVLVWGTSRKRTTLGTYPAISLKDARNEAKRLISIKTLKKHEPRIIEKSYADARDAYLKDCSERNREKTVADYTRLLNRHFKFGKTLVSEITRDDIASKVARLKHTPTEQLYAFVVLKTFFNWAVQNDYAYENPMRTLRRPIKPAARERVLTANELRIVYARAGSYPHPFGGIVWLLILTGQRKSEIGALKWKWIDRNDKTITFPGTSTKNHRTHTIPYGEQVTLLLEDIPKTSEYLFPAQKKHVRGKPTTVFNGWPKAKREFDKGLDVAPYTLHDLRRTFSSNLSMLGTPIHVTEKLLNHVSGVVSGVAAIYNRHSYMDEMRAAIETYEAYLEDLSSEDGRA